MNHFTRQFPEICKKFISKQCTKQCANLMKVSKQFPTCSLNIALAGVIIQLVLAENFIVIYQIDVMKCSYSIRAA